jgi:alpha-L-rhamnosidase
MKAWVNYMKNQSKNDLWNTGFHFGDWLFFSAEDDNDGRSAVTDKYLIAQCFWAHSTQLLINAAKILGKKEDEITYSELLNKIKAAYQREYLTPNGRPVSSTQTAYTLALNFDMFPENLRKQAAERLVDNIKYYKYHITTGFLGTPYITHVLTRFGYDSIAFKLLMQETYPSWLYPVKMGATTIWERWDGIKPDSTFQRPSMNSFNHYAYGAIGDWLYRSVAGIDTREEGVGYKSISIKPHIGGNLTHAKATLQTYYGVVSSAWKLENNALNMDIEIPANTIATIYLPASTEGGITESGQFLNSVKDVQVIPSDSAGYIAVKAGSGKYRFSIPK